MFIAYAHIKFHMPDSRNSLLIFIKLEAKENVCMASIAAILHSFKTFLTNIFMLVVWQHWQYQDLYRADIKILSRIKGIFPRYITICHFNTTAHGF
jgi:hypothetical protein